MTHLFENKDNLNKSYWIVAIRKKHDYRLIVTTSLQLYSVNRILKSVDLKQYFNDIICDDEGVRSKPHTIFLNHIKT